MAEYSVSIVDPATGEVRAVAPEEAEAQFRAGRGHLIPGTRVEVEDEFGNWTGYVDAENAQEALTAGKLRFASRTTMLKHAASERPVQAFAEGFANEVAVPGAYDLPAIQAGMDPALLKASRETAAGQAGQALGFAASLINPFTGGAPGKILSTSAGKIAGHALTGAALDGVVRGATEAAEVGLRNIVADEARRHALAAALGTGAVGAGVGAMQVLDEAALGNVEASAEMILAGAGAGGLLGAGLGGAAAKFAARGARKAGDAAAAEAGTLPVGEMTAALNAQGVPVTEAGMGKWAQRLYAQITSRVTGASEEDVLKVLSPAGREVVLAGQKARDEAVRSTSDLIDRLAEQETKFDLTTARVNDTALKDLSAADTATAYTNLLAGVRDARADLNGLVKAAANYGRTPEQMSAVLRPAFNRLRQAEARISRGSEASAPPKSGPKVYISTDTLDPEQLANGKLVGVRGATTDLEKVTGFAPGRYQVEAPAQGRQVRYDDPDDALAEGMSIYRRVTGESLGLGSTHNTQAGTRLLNDVTVPKGFRKFGMPKVTDDAINSADDLAVAVLEHWQSRIAKLSPQTPPALPAREAVAQSIRDAVNRRMGPLRGESEWVLREQGGLLVPPDETRVYDTHLKRWFTSDEFTAAAGINAPGAAERAVARTGKGPKPAALREAYRELDQVWRVLGAQSRKVQPLLPETPGLDGAVSRLGARLQDDVVFGGAGKAHRELTEATSRVAATRDEVDRLLALRDGKVDRSRVEGWTRKLDTVKGDAVVQAVDRWVRAHQELAAMARKHLDGLDGYADEAAARAKEFGDVYRRAEQDVLTLNAQDRLLQVGRDQGVVPGFAVGGALSMVGLGALAPAGYAITNAVLNPGRAARSIAAMMSFKRELAGRVSRKVGAIFDVRGPGRPTAGTVGATLPKLVVQMMTGTPSERQEAYVRHREELEALAGNPEAYMTTVAPQLGEVAEAMPQHAQAIIAKGPALAAVLEAKRPVPRSTTGGSTPSRFYHLAVAAAADKMGRGAPKPAAAEMPADEDIRQYGMILAVASSPYVVLDWAAEGRLRASHVAAMQAMYPHIFADVQAKMMEAAAKSAESGKPLSPVAERAYDLIMNPGPPMPAEAARQAQQQALYENQRAAPAAPPARNGMKPGDRSRNLTTPNDARASFPF